MRQDARLAAARPREDEEGAVGGGDRLALGVVQPFEEGVGVESGEARLDGAQGSAVRPAAGIRSAARPAVVAS